MIGRGAIIDHHRVDSYDGCLSTDYYIRKNA